MTQPDHEMHPRNQRARRTQGVTNEATFHLRSEYRLERFTALNPVLATQ